MQYCNITLYLTIVVFNHCSTARKPLELIYQRQINLLLEHIETLNRLNDFDNIILYRTPDELYAAPVAKGLPMKNLTRVQKRVGDIIMAYMFTSQLHKPILQFSIQPWDYVNNSKSIPNLGHFLTNRNLVVVILHDIFNIDVKEFVAHSLGASLETKLIFLLIGQELTGGVGFIRVEKLRRFFRWCWSKNILNVILLFQKEHVEDPGALLLEVYTYTPFPDPIELLQLTKVHPRDYFVDRTLDLKGYEFRTPVYQDKPSVFKAYNSRLGCEIVTGISGHLYVEYVKKINGTFTELTGDHSNPWKYQNELLNSRNIDIGIHPYSNMLPNTFHGSYPVTNTNSCVIVPVVPEIFPGLYIPLSLKLNMWVLLLLMFVVFHLTYVCINKLTYGRWQHWNAVSTTLQGILNMPLGNINQAIAFPRVSSKRKLLIHMLLILTGMLYSQIHIAALTSFLSTTLYGTQMETLKDLKAANISVMTLDYLFYAYKYLDLIPIEYESIVLKTDADTVSQHLNSLNTSYAYIIYNAEWKVVQSLQQNLWKPRFKVAPNLCVKNVYLSLPMQFNSPFYHSLQNFILTIQETGLEQIWSENVLWDIRQTTSGRIPLTESRQHPAALTLAHFTVIWCVYAVGAALSLFVFICERIFK